VVWETGPEAISNSQRNLPLKSPVQSRTPRALVNAVDCLRPPSPTLESHPLPLFRSLPRSQFLPPDAGSFSAQQPVSPRSSPSLEFCCPLPPARLASSSHPGSWAPLPTPRSPRCLRAGLPAPRRDRGRGSMAGGSPRRLGVRGNGRGAAAGVGTPDACCPAVQRRGTARWHSDLCNQLGISLKFQITAGFFYFLLSDRIMPC